MGVAALTAGVCLVSAASSLQLLWVAAPAAGFAFGCHWSLMPPLASELFGMRRFATLYCLLQFATTFGTYVFATRLVRACSASLQPPLPGNVTSHDQHGICSCAAFLGIGQRPSLLPPTQLVGQLKA